jgi:hypothetical protein
MTYSKFLSVLTGFDRQVDLSNPSNPLGLAIMELLGSTSGNLQMLASATTTSYSLTWPSAVAAANGYVLTSTTGGVLSWAPSSGGTVTSVSQADGSTTPIFTYSGSPVTSSGTLTQTLSSQAQNSVFSGPVSGSGQPGFRALVIADIPSLSSLYLPLTGGTMTGAINMGAHQINNLAMAGTPAATDAVNVNYVQAVLQGLSPKASVKAATTAALPANTYSNGASGVGATLTANANGVLVVDGYTVQLNDRILVKNEVAALGNGIYFVSTLGTVSVPYVLTRTLDADTCQPASNPSVTSGIWTFVEATSTTLFNQGWMLTTPDPITLGTTALAWTQFYAQGEYIFGNGFTVSGVNISANLLSTGGLSFSGAAIQILLASNSGLSTSASGLTTNYDNSTIGVNGSNQLYVPSAGITKTQINTNVFDQVTITGGAGTAASVASTPSLKRTLVAGQTFTANTSYAVRWGLTANSETANRVYAADITTSSFDLFYVIGMASSGTTVNAGGTITVTGFGSFNLSSADTAFGANTDGAPVFLTASGTFSLTAPSTSGQAVTRLGIVQVRSATNTSCIIDVDPVPVGVN